MEPPAPVESSMASSSPWLAGLHYAYPIVVFLYYVVSSAVATCTLQTITVNKQHPRRLLITALMLFATLTFLAQFILVLIQYRAHGAWLGQQDDTIVGLLSCTLVYGVVLAGLMAADIPVWHPYIGPCVMALVFEPAVVASTHLSTSSRPWSMLYILQSLQLSTIACRYISLAVVVVIYFAWKNKSDRDTGGDSEQQPLLQKSTVEVSEETLIGATTEYGSTDRPATDANKSASRNPECPWERREREAKEQVHKRLQETGNWFTYSRKFMLFFPYVWPVNNKLLQLRVVLVGLCLLAGNALHVLIPRQLGRVTDTLSDVASHSTNARNPWIEVLVFAGLKLSASEAGVTLLRQWLWVPVQYYSTRALNSAAYAHILNLSSDFHDSKNSTDLMVAISSAQGVSDLLESVCFSAIPNLIDITVAFAYLSWTFGPYEGFITFATSIIFLYISAFIMSRLKVARRSEISAWFQEHYVQQAGFLGWSTVTSFNQTPYEEQRYSGAVQDRVAKSQTLFFGYLVAHAFQYLILLAGLLAGSFLAVYQVTNGQATPGEFVMLLTLWAQLVGPLNFFATLGKKIWRDLIAAERLLDVMQTKPTVVNKHDALPFDFKGGSIKFDNVHFSYDNKKPILKGVDLSIPAGITAAFVGATGAGKSTILKLLDRFYDPTAGNITIDGQDIRDVDISSLRAQIGIVPQAPILFDDTIMNNIRYAKLDATDEEVFEACKAAAVHDQIIGFTDGYDTRVGERGIKLSGGELQRIAIARAILKRPSIVLLDEATSSVDTETEALIQDALRTLCKGRTTFVVAHRLSTIVNADRIIVVANGEVVEQGSHDELMMSEGRYAELWSKQIFVKPKEQAPAERIYKDQAPKMTNIINDLIPDATAEVAPSTTPSQPAEAKTPSGHKREGSKLNPDAPEFTPRSLLHIAASGGTPTSTSKSKPNFYDPFEPAPINATTITPVKTPCYAEPPVVSLPLVVPVPFSESTNRSSVAEQTISEESQHSGQVSPVIAPVIEANTSYTGNNNNRKTSFKVPRYHRRAQSKSEPYGSNSTEDA